MNVKSEKIYAKGMEIGIQVSTAQEDYYITLTDIAKYKSDDPPKLAEKEGNNRIFGAMGRFEQSKF